MHRSLARGLAALAVGLLLSLAAAPALAGDLTGVVNVNTATAEELASLPGVGEVKAAAILALRQERGRFRSVDELLEVKGIGPVALEKMRPHLALDGETTLARP